MYNRYIPNGTAYTRVSEPEPSPPPPHGPGDGGGTPSGIVERLLRALKLEDLDAGDLLLLLILFLLFSENGGKDDELLLALGLLLIL